MGGGDDELRGPARFYLKAESLGLLQIGNYLKQVSGLGIAGGAEHAQETFFRDGCGFGKLRVSNRCFDVVAQDGLCRFQVAGDEAFDAFAQQLAAEGAIFLRPGEYGFSEIACEGHVCFTFPSGWSFCIQTIA